MATSVVGGDEYGNVVPKGGGIEPTPFAFWASILTILPPGSVMVPPYSCLPVYAVPCLRGQCNIQL